MLAQHAAESQWLKELVPQLPTQLREGLVAHRGFHYPQLEENRPLECTLPAMKSAWEAGLRLCECDVRVSSDGRILLSHDETLDRLTATTGTPKITELTAEQLCQWPLRQPESHIVCLEEVLNTALANSCQLVIELKGCAGPCVGEAVASFFGQKPQLLKACALVMSFELAELHGFARGFEEQRRHVPGLNRPQLLLLTCVPQPDLQAKYQTLDVGSASSMETALQYLEQKDLCLDGFYMEWTEQLTSTHKEALHDLCKRCTVGVWQRFGQTDCAKEAAKLLDVGVRYCNSDLPRDFMPQETAV